MESLICLPDTIMSDNLKITKIARKTVKNQLVSSSNIWHGDNQETIKQVGVYKNPIHLQCFHDYAILKLKNRELS